jgi:hypothetical protein
MGDRKNSLLAGLFLILFIFLTIASSGLPDLLGLKELSDTALFFVVIASITCGVLSFYLFIVHLIDKKNYVFKNEIDETKTKIQNLLSANLTNMTNIVSGTKYEDEGNILNQVLKQKIGDAVSDLLSIQKYPFALVPGGDIAIFQSQVEYSEILTKLLQTPWESVYWTTCIPFEELNYGLCVKNSRDVERWNYRVQGSFDGFFGGKLSGNKQYAEYIQMWKDLSSLDKKQLIFFSKETDHPLYINNYFKYPWIYDLIKYCHARFSTEDPEHFNGLTEAVFNEDRLQIEYMRQDDNMVKWSYLEDLIDYTNNIHYPDFIIFKGNGGYRFVLARIEPTNYLRKKNEGLVGISLLVHMEDNVNCYKSAFDTIYEKHSHRSFVEIYCQTLQVANLKEGIIDSFNNGAEDYTDDDKNWVNPFTDLEFTRSFEEKIKAIGENPLQFLYAGAGPGVILKSLCDFLDTKNISTNIEAIDNAKKMVEYALTKSMANQTYNSVTYSIQHEDINLLKQKGKSKYDVVVCLNNTLGNLINSPKTTLDKADLVKACHNTHYETVNKFAAIIKPGGFLFLSIYMDTGNKTDEKQIEYSAANLYCINCIPSENGTAKLLHFDKNYECSNLISFWFKDTYVNNLFIRNGFLILKKIQLKDVNTLYILQRQTT